MNRFANVRPTADVREAIHICEAITLPPLSKDVSDVDDFYREILFFRV